MIQIVSGPDLYRILDVTSGLDRLPRPSLEVGDRRAESCLDIYFDRDRILDSLGPIRVRYQMGINTPSLLLTPWRRVLVALNNEVHDIDNESRSVSRLVRVDVSVAGMAIVDFGVLVIGELEVVALDEWHELWRTPIRDLIVSFAIADGGLNLKLDDQSVVLLNLQNGNVLATT